MNPLKLPPEEKKRRQREAYKRWRLRKIENKECTKCTLPLDKTSAENGNRDCLECRKYQNKQASDRSQRGVRATILRNEE